MLGVDLIFIYVYHSDTTVICHGDNGTCSWFTWTIYSSSFQWIIKVKLMCFVVVWREKMNGSAYALENDLSTLI